LRQFGDGARQVAQQPPDVVDDDLDADGAGEFERAAGPGIEAEFQVGAELQALRHAGAGLGVGSPGPSPVRGERVVISQIGRNGGVPIGGRAPVQVGHDALTELIKGDLVVPEHSGDQGALVERVRP